MAEIRAVIHRQIDAFRRDDAQGAFALVSPGVQQAFGTPERFLDAVRAGYRAVYRPASVSFLELVVMGGDVVQQVQVIDRSGAAWVAYYAMQRQRDGSWRTNGCHLDPADPHDFCIIRAQWKRPHELSSRRARSGAAGPILSGRPGMAPASISRCSRSTPSSVELCLFDPKGRREIDRVPLRERTDYVWHCYLPEARPGPALRLPRPRAARPRPRPPLRPQQGPARSLCAADPRKVSAGLGRCEVVDPAFSWGDDRAPRTPWQDTVIYELHVKGFTQLHPEVPPQVRGTYAGLCSSPVIAHLKNLGVTAVELLPIHAIADERRLLHHGLRNYWGYNSIGYFAPEMRYSATGTLGEFKTMVKTLHAAGIEVILDVVYNHTAEGDASGPTLSFRGIDNAIYYRLDPAHPRRYLNFAGTGNSLNTAHRVVLALVMDSLRYWVEEMHVDGFRFDLAATLARNAQGAFDRNGAFLSAVRQDPVLSRVKLIAEPWDLGEGGYQLGNFPPGWAEWNDKYRDAVRSYWRGDEGVLGALASRLSGSKDLFQPSGRAPTAGINFVTTHDGFTLQDLVSYERKHNEANLEEQPRRQRQQPQLERRGRRPDARRLDLAAQDKAEAKPARHAPFLTRRADCSSPATSLVAPSTATTTPTARTTKCPGWIGKARIGILRSGWPRS